jgi:ribosomal protein S12 methylthiotransferase
MRDDPRTVSPQTVIRKVDGLKEALAVYVHTVGCAKNLVDSEILLGQMGDAVRLVEEGSAADLIIINTCGFIDAARVESIDAVLEAVRLKSERPGRRVAVMGCLTERYRDEISAEIPELDGVYGVGEFGALLRDAGLRPGPATLGGPDELELFSRRVLLSPAHSAYLRISDGCDQHCTYCSIPLMRGRMRSRKPDELLREAEQLVKRGVQEINIIGQEISSYGRDLGSTDIVELLGRLDGCGAPWLRLLYSHPPLVDERFAQAMASSTHILPYLDFPVEHVSGSVLKRMARRGDAASLAAQVRMLRATVPGLVLRTSLIIGFPGEREEDFQELLAFLREHPFDRLGVFLWSPEEGTPSLQYPNPVPRELAEERRDRIMEEQMERSLEANQALIGTRDRILVDECEPGANHSLGRGYRDALDIDNSVELEGRHRPGTFVDAEYIDAQEYDLVARPLKAGE